MGNSTLGYATSSSYSYRDFDADANRLYDHLLDLRNYQAPEEHLQSFQSLFLAGVGYNVPEMVALVDRLLTCPWAEQDFHHILNRCCYTLINQWLMHPESRGLTVTLIEVLAAAAEGSGISARSRRVRKLIHKFIDSEQYAGLRRYVQTVGGADDNSLSSLISRYPNLYPYYLSDMDSSESGAKAIQQLQQEREQAFEQDLLSYSAQVLVPRHGATAVRPNPTLLTPQQLAVSVRQFAGKTESGLTYRDEASGFLRRANTLTTCRSLKQQMYDYLTESLEQAGHGKYGRLHFNRFLESHLKSTLPQNDDLKPNGFLLTRLCSQVLDLLVASPAQSREHHVRFVSLIDNLGATFITGLLLKVVLLCRGGQQSLAALRAHLEKRLAGIFRHYEGHGCEGLEWFIQCLDNWMIASSIHFGQTGYQQWVKLVA